MILCGEHYFVLSVQHRHGRQFDFGWGGGGPTWAVWRYSSISFTHCKWP